MSETLPLPYTVLLFVVFSALFWPLVSILFSYRQRRTVLAHASSDYDRDRVRGGIGVLKPLLQDVARRLEGSPLTERWMRDNQGAYQGKLVHAGTPGGLTGAEFLALKAIAPFVMFLLVFAVLGPDQMLLSLAAALLGLWLPDNWLREQHRARVAAIESSLSDALDGFALMMEAGLDLGQAIASYVDDPERTPLMEELALMNSEVRLGKTRSQAMDAMAAKVDSAELSNLVTAITQAEQSGVSLASYLSAQAAEMRNRRFTIAEEQAQKAPLKMLGPLMLLIMPCVFLVLFGPMYIMYRQGQ